MARLMPTSADLIVPVPLHRSRLWSRGFNQAALIAGGLGKLSGVPDDPLILQRHRATPMLRRLSARDRAKAVKGVFRLSTRDGRLRGKAIVLVDDIHTSGATSDACTAVLLRGGAASVTILCWARVLNAETGD